jgi:eukaryotic-like serine/threonine-protein kinase
MGVVYKAEDTLLHRTVALKLLPPEFTNSAEAKARLLREAQAASSFQHQNICTIHEIGETSDGQVFICMDYYEGETLKDCLTRLRTSGSVPMPLPELLNIAAQIAQGLAKAHDKGVIHRDIKPGNIVITTEGVVKILDFGLAQFAGGSKLMRAGSTAGTIAYLSPEQASGENIDHRTDIWSLGVVLYEMCTGKLPFDHEVDAAVIYAILDKSPVAPSQMGVSVPPELEQVILRCLQKDPGQRYQRMHELRHELTSIQAGSQTGKGGAAPRGEPTAPSIAVFPFVSMSSDPENEFFSDGLAEEIINALTRIPGLRVIARTSSFLVGRMGLDIRDAGARLGVENVLEGSVRRAGNRVRVTAMLVSTHDGSHLWSDQYDREMTDLLVLEDDVAETIAERLRGKLGRAASERKRQLVNHEAYVSFLEGRHHFALGTPETLTKAIASYQRAIKLDPEFALAYDSLAELFWFLGFFGNVPPRDAFSSSTWYALRALELDDTLAETHALLGMLRKELDYNWPEVDRECRRALELNSESPLVRLRYAISGLMPHGRVIDAAAELDRVVRLDPLSIPSRWWLAIMLYFSRQFKRMAEEGTRIIALDPNHFLGHWVIGIHRDAIGAGTEAVASMEKAHELSGGSLFTLGFLAFVRGRAGHVDEARRLMADAQNAAKGAYVPPSTIALGHVGLGEWDAAFDFWNQAIEVRDPLVMPLKSYPFFDSLRGDMRYQSMLRIMNLVEE